MAIISNGNEGDSYLRHISEAVEASSGVDIAVSYFRYSGWCLLRPILSAVAPEQVRILVTDQFFQTQPSAIEEALSLKYAVYLFRGEVVFHPKVYLFKKGGMPHRAIVGSANISDSALQTGVEFGLSTTDRKDLDGIAAWYERLISSNSDLLVLGSDRLAKLSEDWRQAASDRVKSVFSPKLLKRGGTRGKASTAHAGVGVSRYFPEQVESAEDLLISLTTPLGLLGFDHAGNNVRSLSHALNLLKQSSGLSGKQVSEMKLLGFYDTNGTLSRLGSQGSKCCSESELAKLWCQWIHDSSDDLLVDVNYRLLAFKKAAKRFWNLNNEIRDYFLANVGDKSKKITLQMIEIISNGDVEGYQLTLEDVEVIGSRLGGIMQKFPRNISSALRDYLNNKGARTWGALDRSTVMKAWREIAR